ncbi:PAS sensor protein, partial [Streptomyces sp. WAC06614]
MNFTRWSARFPGTQRRAAARTEHAARAQRGEGSVPAARASAPDGRPADPTVSGTGTGAALGTPPSLDDLSVREVLGRLPALVALLHG